MAQALAKAEPRAPESQFAAEFELAAYLTLGLCYQRTPRFAGGAYLPFLRRVDRLSVRALPVALRERAGFAAKLLEIDARVKEIVAGLAARGFKSPYLRTLVVARINPVRFVQQKRGEAGPAMPIGAALLRMAASAKKFDLAGVRERDLALVAVVAGDGAQAE